MCSLAPFTDGKDIIRAGGQIGRSGLNEEYMHPIILPKKSKVTELIIKSCHLKAAHCGRGITLNEIRDRGFWIINASSITKSVVFFCKAEQPLRGMDLQEKKHKKDYRVHKICLERTYC